MFVDDLRDSVYDFYRLVLPILSQLTGWRFVAVEGIVSDKHKDLVHLFDTLAGIDLFVITPNGIRGVANRVQWSPVSYNTFTIRKERWTGTTTEYEKKKIAIEKGYIYPYYTIQSYITERRTGDLLSFAMARTSDIIDLASKNNIDGVYEKVNHHDGNIFICVEWELFHREGKPIFIYQNNK